MGRADGNSSCTYIGLTRVCLSLFCFFSYLIRFAIYLPNFPSVVISIICIRGTTFSSPSYLLIFSLVTDIGLCEALRQFRSSPASKDVSFTIKYLPYQLYPEASAEGEDKYEWYRSLTLPLFHPLPYLLRCISHVWLPY